MKVKLDYNSQDITIFLDEVEFIEKTRTQSDGFFDDEHCTKIICPEASAYFFINHSKDLVGIFNREDDLDGGVQLKLPQEVGDPYLINLLPEAVRNLRNNKQYIGRYLGGAKLMISIQENV